jgi:hypothetical protein
MESHPQKRSKELPLLFNFGIYGNYGNPTNTVAGLDGAGFRRLTESSRNVMFLNFTFLNGKGRAE